MTPYPAYERNDNLYTSIQRSATRRSAQLKMRLAGTGLIAAAFLLFWGWYTVMEGSLLIFPSSAQECGISDMNDPGHYRIMASLKRSLSVKEIFGQDIAFKASDETGTVNVRTHVKANETAEPVEVVGVLRKFKTGIVMDAIWIDGRFSWLQLLELALPIAALGSGILLLILSFSRKPDRPFKEMAGVGSQKLSP